MKLVSLITGCYNGEKFIDRCFNSILAQTFDDMEVIFVDDGSIDQSLQIAKSYKSKFSDRGLDFKIIAQENMGFYPQTGIKVSNGKYITTLDIDDVLLPTSIQKRAEFLEKNADYAAVRTSGYIVYENDTSRAPVIFTTENESKDYDVFEDLIFAKTNNWPGTYMVKSDVLFEYYPDRILPMTRLTQNLQILLPVTYNRKVGFINEPLMHYMRHDDQCTSDKNDYKTAKKQFEAFKEVRKIILQRMELFTKEMENKLDRTYETIYLRLAYDYKLPNEFNLIYSRIQVPIFEERYMKAAINKNIIKRLFLSIQNKLGLRK